MSDFFGSEMVRNSMEELAQLQEKIFKNTLYLPVLDKEGRREHIQLMKDFLEKQRLLYVRMSLSDDPEAIETKNKIMESAKMFGLIEGNGMNEFFDTLSSTIEKLEKTLDF